jgi:hypothetical protein
VKPVAVMTPHPNEWTCGTGKWSIRLAEQLCVPCLPLTPPVTAPAGLVVVSTRMSEIPTSAVPPPWFDLIVHDWTTWDDFTWPKHWDRWIEKAERIYAANQVLYEQIRVYRSDVQILPIPSATTVPFQSNLKPYRVLTFGMAHKRLASHFEALKGKLEREQPDYQIRLSTAVHEGSPWDASLQRAEATLRPIFGKRLKFLGYLADDALIEELHSCDAVALYYTPALRANNTSYWVAKEAGKRIFTNRDEDSPPESAAAPTWDAVSRMLCGA